MNCYKAKYRMYADDIQIYTSTTFNELQKTECIIFYSKSHMPPPITHIKIANKDIPIKNTILILLYYVNNTYTHLQTI